jgi:hypothetical protein
VQYERVVLSNTTLGTLMASIYITIAEIALCKSLAKEILDNEKVDELLQFSNKVIYQETGSKNRYFLIKEPA